jgi:hypothetical protein
MDDKPPPEEFLDGEKTLNMRPRFPVPYPDDELIPVMGLLDEFMLTRESEPPPMRSLDGWPVEVRAHAPIGMHELAAAGVNDEETSGYTRLPPPKLLTLARHTPSSMALMVERYVAFYKLVVPKKKGAAPAEVPKRLPATFVTHYLHFRASRLPRVWALATTPLILPNGQILAANGLVREQGVVFRIAPQIAEAAPTGRAGGAAVEHALSRHSIASAREAVSSSSFSTSANSLAKSTPCPAR